MSTLTEWAAFKFYAARTLWRMVRRLSNWREVWSSYRCGLIIPPLRFRSGAVLYHGVHDSPISLLHEVFSEHHYTRHVQTPLEGVMIDLGANIGAVTVDWARRAHGLRVHAFEPNPATNLILRHNIEANGLKDSVSIHDEAVGRGSGELALWTNINSMAATGYSESPPMPGAVVMRVPLIDLNEAVGHANGDAIALLKMDIEGAEADALESATPDTLKKIKQVVLEYHDGRCPGAEARCKKVLERAGFRCRVRRLNMNHGLIYASRPKGSAAGN